MLRLHRGCRRFDPGRAHRSIGFASSTGSTARPEPQTRSSVHAARSTGSSPVTRSPGCGPSSWIGSGLTLLGISIHVALRRPAGSPAETQVARGDDDHHEHGEDSQGRRPRRYVSGDEDRRLPEDDADGHDDQHPPSSCPTTTILLRGATGHAGRLRRRELTLRTPPGSAVHPRP